MAVIPAHDYHERATKLRLEAKALLTDDGKGAEAVERAEGMLEEANSLDKRYATLIDICLLYTSPSPRDGLLSRMPSSA